MEKKGKQNADHQYTYGYGRYSVIGSVIMAITLIIGAIFIIINAIVRISNPTPINYNGMIIFAIIGIIINSAAVFITSAGKSLNQKAVKLHMLEDAIGWIIVLIGAVIMRFTDIVFIDSVLSVGMAIFILIYAIKNLKQSTMLLLEKIPENISLKVITDAIMDLDGVLDIHHIHIWSIDGINHCATMHIIAENCHAKIKNDVRNILKIYHIDDVTIEVESIEENCGYMEHFINQNRYHCHHAHTHHH